MIGHIYINGQIGSSEESKGVELQDVVVQVEANKGSEILHFHITSQGGSVRVGRLIANYISTLQNAFTIAEDYCASMGTEIHLAVPLANRRIVEGTQYFIHNPLLDGVSGNADELAEMSAHIKVYEKEMLSMYMKATGLNKSALEGLMKQETSLTSEQCKSLGFASEVIPALEFKAVAFMDKTNNNKNESLTEMKKSLLEDIKGIVANAFNPEKEKKEVTAMTVNTDKGELTYESEGVLPETGEAVMLDGTVAAEGSYSMEDGTVINVNAEGNVSEVLAGEIEEETVEALKAKIAEMEAKHSEEREADKIEMMETFKAEMEAVKKTIGSSHTIKAETKKFNKKAPANELSFKEKLEAKQEEYKK